MQQDKQIRNHIRKHRQEAGLTEQALGEMIGVSHRSISLLELSQQLDPRVSYALRLAKALKCTVEDLFEKGVDPPMKASTLLAKFQD